MYFSLTLKLYYKRLSLYFIFLKSCKLLYIYIDSNKNYWNKELSS